MPENKAAVKKGGSLNQAMIDAIERRLSLMGGTTLLEMGADLAERFGSTGAILRKKQSEMYTLDPRQQLSVEERKKARGEFEAQIEKIRATLKDEIAGYRTLITEYVEKMYGEPIRNGQTKGIMGYGDRIEIKKGHLKKTW